MSEKRGGFLKITQCRHSPRKSSVPLMNRAQFKSNKDGKTTVEKWHVAKKPTTPKSMTSIIKKKKGRSAELFSWSLSKMVCRKETRLPGLMWLNPVFSQQAGRPFPGVHHTCHDIRARFAAPVRLVWRPKNLLTKNVSPSLYFFFLNSRQCTASRR